MRAARSRARRCAAGSLPSAAWIRRVRVSQRRRARRTSSRRPPTSRECARRCRGWRRSPRASVPVRSSGRQRSRATSLAACAGTNGPGATGAARAVDLLLAKLAGDDADGGCLPFRPRARRLPRFEQLRMRSSRSSPKPAACRRAIPMASRPSVPPRGFATPSPTSARSSPAATSPCTAASTSRRRTPTPTGSCPWTPSGSSRVRAGSGSLHEIFYTTTGNGTPVAVSTKFGQEIAEELKEAGVEAVILSGT